MRQQTPPARHVPATTTLGGKIVSRMNVVQGVAAAVMMLLEAELGGGLGGWKLVLAIANATVIAGFTARTLHTLRGDWRQIRRPHVALMVIAVVLLSAVSVRIAAGLVVIHDGLLLLLWLRAASLSGRVLEGIGTRPARSLVVSFLTMIAVGTFLLSLPAASAVHATRGDSVSLIDAFFTAVSATCVTGLITVDTATAWSPFGQGVILALFQLGGLGIMVISSAVALAFGEALGARRGEALRGVFDEADVEALRGLLRTVIYGTFAIEAVGALLLFVRFAGDMPTESAVVHAVFHSVSAFCNAGFSLNADSLMGYASDVWVNVVVIGLLTLGGLGFGVIIGLRQYLISRGRRRLSVHAKLVLSATAMLLWGGAVLFFFFEYDRSLAHLPLGSKLLAATFQSATTRTAGFNTVALSDLHPVTILVMIGLMFVGASPGSTGGGVKTTTCMLVLLAARAYLFEREDVEVFGRRIEPSSILRALAVIGGSVAVFMLGFGALLTLEDLPFESLAFEAASALGTAGLSLGITSELSSPGRTVVAAMMFLGRVGPLTAVAALSIRRPQPASMVLPTGKVLIG